MTDASARPHDVQRPLIAAFLGYPLLSEAIRSALDFAEVHSFSAYGENLAGLLPWLRPALIITDTEFATSAVSAFAKTSDTPLLQITMHDQTLRLFRNGTWDNLGKEISPTPEELRNVIVGALFAREESKA